MKLTWNQDSVELVESKRIATTVPKKKLGYARSSSSLSIYKKKKKMPALIVAQLAVYLFLVSRSIYCGRSCYTQLLYCEKFHSWGASVKLCDIYMYKRYRNTAKREYHKNNYVGPTISRYIFFSWRRMATWQLFQYYTRSSFYVHRKKNYPRQIAQF